MSDTEHYLRIERSGGEQPLEFADPKQIVEFVEQELKFWTWLEGAEESGVGDSWKTIRQQFESALDNSNYLASHTAETSDKNELQAKKVALKKSLDNVYVRKRMLLSKSKDAAFVTMLRDTVSVSVASSAAMFLAGPDSNNRWELMAGIAYVCLYKNVISQPEFKSVLDVWKAHQSEWAALSNDCRVTATQYKNDFNAFKKDLDAVRNGYGEQFQNLIKISKDEMTKLEELYDKGLALKKPVKYWELKAKQHQTRIRWLSGGFAVYLLLVIGCGIGLLASMVSLLDITSPEQVAYQHVLIFITLLTIVAYPMHIISRLLMSNIHLQSDAEERRTMANTYLALLRNEKVPEKKDLQLILEALFRPSVSGVVKEEGSANLLTWLFARMSDK